ncbi:MAG: DUF364 domain-containing protein, partial [Pseudomonadota bacterium]
MSVSRELLGLCRRADAALTLPKVSVLAIPEANPTVGGAPEFGMVGLEDDCAGLYYAWLGDTQKNMPAKFAETPFIGQSPLHLAALLESNDEADRSLGIAAVNAITRFVYRRAAFQEPAATSSVGGIDLGKTAHLGMVGNFPSLVAQAGKRGIRVTVIERKTHMLRKDGDLEITADLDALKLCDAVILTGSTLINDSLDDVLAAMPVGARVTMIGPTCGFFPDPLLARLCCFV